MQEAYTEEGAKQLLENFDIRFISADFAVCVIRVNDSGTIEKKQQEFVVQNIFGELAQQQGVGFFAQSGDNRYLLLVNFRQDAPETMAFSPWQEACELLKLHFDANVAVYLSRKHTGVSEIPAAFREAQIAEKYSYLMGEENMIALLRLVKELEDCYSTRSPYARPVHLRARA